MREVRRARLPPVVGPELEFYLLRATDETSDSGWKRYADGTGNVYVVGLKGDPRERAAQRRCAPAGDDGLEVTAANHEFCSGQFEINLNHCEPLDAADRAFRMKIAVQEIARHEGMLATFMAKPFNDEGGSGSTCTSRSGRRTSSALFDDPDGANGLSDLRRHAVAGVLAHAPALAAISNPTINSYKRFGPDTLAPWLIDWGLDNRSAMVRIPPERGRASRMELRLGDATANPYLAIAGMLAAALLGIQDKTEPPEPLEGYGYDVSRVRQAAAVAGGGARRARGRHRVRGAARRVLREVVPVLQAQRDRALQHVDHRLGVPRVHVPPLIARPLPRRSPEEEP